MKTTYISREKNDVKISMEFTPEEFEAAQVEAYKKNKNRFQIDGFRKGKAPKSLIERYYGSDVFYEEAIEYLFAMNYENALAEYELETIGEPVPELSPLEKGKGFTLTLTIPCYPVVAPENYKGIEIEKVDDTVSDEEVNREIENMRRRNARMVLVERPAKDGDILMLDYSGYIGDEQFDGGTAERQELKLGAGMFIPGFEEQLVGATPGEKRDVTVTFPDEYHAKDLAGKEAVFHCLVHEVREEQLPELDDEFAKDVSEHDTLEELKKATRDRIEKYSKIQAENQMKDALIKKMTDANNVDIPDIMIDDEVKRMKNEFSMTLRQQGLTPEQYYSIVGGDESKLEGEMKEAAAERIKTRILLLGIAEKEEIEVSTEEMDEEIKSIAIHYDTDAEQLKRMLGVENLTYIMSDLKVKKAIDFIYDNADIK